MEIVFTEHAKDRIKKRKITEDEVINAIKYPNKIEKKKGSNNLRLAAEHWDKPWKTLIATILSARSLDETTIKCK